MGLPVIPVIGIPLAYNTPRSFENVAEFVTVMAPAVVTVIVIVSPVPSPPAVACVPAV